MDVLRHWRRRHAERCFWKHQYDVIFDDRESWARKASERADELKLVHQQLEGAVSLTGEELHCLICAMAGNFPDRFKPLRMDLLRKLSKAQHALGGQYQDPEIEAAPIQFATGVEAPGREGPGLKADAGGQ